MSESARRLPSLYRKTLTSWCSVVAVVVLTGGFLGSHRLEQQAVDFLTQPLPTSARLMEAAVRPALAQGQTVETLQAVARVLGQQASCRVTVIDPAGTVLGDSEQTEATVRLMENHNDRPEVRDAL